MAGGGPFRHAVMGMLRRVLPADWAEDIVRDLEEAYGRRRRVRGRLRADVWLTGQAVLFAARFALAAVEDMAGRSADGGLVHGFREDVAYTFRSVRRSPFFYGTVILTLAVGMGANTAIFGVVRTVVLEPLPHPHAERLLVLDPHVWRPSEIALELRRSGGVFDEVVGSYPRPFAIEGDDGPVEMEGAEITPGFLHALGAEPALGRHFVEADTGSAAAPTAVLSWNGWQRHLGGAPDVVGRTLRIDGVPREIVGVVARGFRPLTPRTDDPDIWIPGALGRLGLDVLPEGSPSWGIPVARLREGVPASRGQAALDGAVERYRERHPEARNDPRWDLRWTTLHDHLTRDVRPALLMLQGAVGLVLLLACANVANLLLVRFASRRDEVAIRTALGASRTRLLRQHLTESLLLAGLGGVAGLAVTLAGLEAVLALAPPELPRLSEVALDASVLAFGLGVAVLTGLAVGLSPAMRATRTAPGRVLKEGGRTATRSRRRHRFSQGLVVAEIAMTLVLLVGAGLLGRSFVELLTRSPGFRTREVLAIPLHVPDHRYETVPRLEDYYHRLEDRLAREPGIASAAISNNLPLERAGSRRLYVVEGENEPREAQYGVVSPAYFRTLDIPILRGRAIEDGDRRGSPPVAVVDEVMRREVWPDVDPVGRRFRFVDEEEWITVVGVSAAIRGGGLAREPGPGFHISYQQRPATPVELGVGRNAVVLVRVAPGAGVESRAAALRRAVQDVDPRQPVPEITTLDGVVSAAIHPQRFRAALLGAFATLALLLAITGIAGVVGHVTAERSHEFGVRRAMGATDRDVMSRVLGWGLRRAALGIGVGVAGALLLGRFLSSLLVAVTPTDAPTILAAVGLVLLATVAACLVPAIRAVRVDAGAALRHE